MTRYILTGMVALGACIAAAGAEAATVVVTHGFDFVSTAGTPFTLVAGGLSHDVQFNTSLGALNSIEIAWSDITLTATGKSKQILGGLGGGSIADFATGSVTAGGIGTGSITTNLGLATVLGVNKTITAVAKSSGLAQTFSSGAIFDQAAAGDVMTVAWNTGDIKGLNATSLSQLAMLSQSDILYLNARPVSAELEATLTVTYDYTAAPELSTWGMMGLGFAGLGLAGARSRRTPVAALA